MIQRLRKVRFCVRCQTERPFRGRVCVVCRKQEPKESKYHNRPTRDASGALRHSQLEADHGSWLHAAQQGGAIENLQAQVKYRLDLYGNGAVEQLLEAVEASSDWYDPIRKLVEAVRLSKRHITSYILDYQYEEANTGRTRYEDPKGQRKGLAWEHFQVKRRLMKLAHGIDVEPVFSVGGRRCSLWGGDGDDRGIHDGARAAPEAGRAVRGSALRDPRPGAGRDAPRPHQGKRPPTKAELFRAALAGKEESGG